MKKKTVIQKQVQKLINAKERQRNIEMRNFVRVRDEILRTMNVDAFRQSVRALAPQIDKATDDVVLASMHKARAQIPAMGRELRLESIEWLRARGWSLYSGIPLPPPGELPV